MGLAYRICGGVAALFVGGMFDALVNAQKF
jgi:hypothetical protein